MGAATVIAIDGPSGVGKSTLARLLAQALGLPILDTGAMFRILAYSLGPGAAELDDAELAARLPGFSFQLAGSGENSRLTCNGMPFGNEIRTEEVAHAASTLGARPVVRAFLKAAQQEIGRGTSLVTEGRDMGTVIFPDATRKFYLEATPEVRAQRRARQLAEAGSPTDPERLAQQIRERDHQDTTRAVAPLRPADDAVIVHTDHLDIQGVLDAMLREIS